MRARAATAVVVVALAASWLGCRRGPSAKPPEPEPRAEPAPVEIDWPDAGGPGPR